MTSCKDGKCACCDQSTLISKDMAFFEKARAHIKGDILGKPLNGREYYFLMFGCVNAQQIKFVKDCGEKLKGYINKKDWAEAEKIIKETHKFRDGAA